METVRRDFLRVAGMGIAGVSALIGQRPKRVLVEPGEPASFLRRLAERELLRGLSRLLGGSEVRLGTGSADLTARLEVDARRYPGPEDYSIATEGGRLLFTAAGESALLYSIFDFLERQGVSFGIDGESYPLDGIGALLLPAQGKPWTASPRFAVRGLLPWPDFLNCITVYNQEDFRAYFEAMLRMRFNTFGMHVYSGAQQWAESYLSFEFAGVGHLGFLDNSASHRWGYLPMRTSRMGMGASQFYDSEVFGADATRLSKDPWEIAEKTQALLSQSLDYARRLGIRTGLGFEPYQIPDEIWRALPPEVKPPELPGRRTGGPRFDIESVTAKKLLEARLAQLLEAYPDVDYVWLWEDEQMNWESRKTGIPLSTTPFLQAHDFLRRQAPKKRMVLSGWGGVARHFEHFHKTLPGDVIFSCLSDSLGWDPVHEAFGKLESRERWPIPWLEDDPAMWLPQFHVHRFKRDLDIAAGYGCQGLLGIHWRHRIVDPTAVYQARFSWDKSLSPAGHYLTYAKTQASGQRARRLAEILDDADRNRKLLSTGTGDVKDGHEVTREFSGDYNEAFTFWSNYEPRPEVMATQKAVAAAMRELAAQAASPRERERLGYIAGHVEFLAPYAEAWVLAHRLHGLLQKAAKLDKQQARDLVRAECLPLWLKLAPEVRRAVTVFQRIVANRNDLGTLVSIHNKFVRLSMFRLRLSMQEYLGELPPDTERLFAATMAPDKEAPARLIVPSRPTILARGEKARVLAIVTGGDPVGPVTLRYRAHQSGNWREAPARLAGRRTFQAELGAFEPEGKLVEYYFSAETQTQRLVSPPGAPEESYLVTLV